MVDPNEFFRETTLRLCGHLAIEEGLHACIGYLSRHLPVDAIYLEKYEADLGAMRFVARASPDKGERMDLLVPMSASAKTLAAQDLKEIGDPSRQVFIIDNSDDHPIARDLVEALGLPPQSILGIMLAVSGEFAGSVILAAEGTRRFTDRHAQLCEKLKEPFFVAMSNALKHREVLKLKDMLADDNRYLHSELHRISGNEIVGANFGLKAVMDRVRQVAGMDSPVLILGETGTGKDLIAHEIHDASSRSRGPFVSINCGAIPESLIDSELFGHEKGAFTGALSQKRGRFERANNGTIFLDEIGELPPAAQVRLLRVLQSREIERVGGERTIALNIRIVAATNRNLEEMVKQRAFREDLWFRLNVFPILVPPLRHRRSDIPSLVQHLLDRKARQLNIADTPVLADGAMDTLMAYAWPGNVRELENVIERAMILHRGHPLRFDDLGLGPSEPGGAGIRGHTRETLNLDAVIKAHIQRVLDRSGGKIHGPGGAGDLLGVHPGTLRSRMIKLGIPFRKTRPSSEA